MFVLSTYTIISLPRTPDCVTAEARITEFFGETQTDGRPVRISRASLGFHGIGVVHARGSLEVALPPTSSTEFCRRQGHVRGQRRRRATAGPGSSVCYSAVVKVNGINMMKEEFLEGPTMGGRPYGAPKSTSALGDDRSDDDAICEPPQPLRDCRRVNSSRWAGNSPKQARVALGRK